MQLKKMCPSSANVWLVDVFLVVFWSFGALWHKEKKIYQAFDAQKILVGFGVFVEFLDDKNNNLMFLLFNEAAEGKQEGRQRIK